jgi:4-carboxymuconolactone decarboxylase
MDDSRYERGREVRRAVLGAAHVARTQAQQTPLDADFQRFITEVAWGSVWARPGLDLRTRSLITLAVLAALGRTEELRLHLRGSQNLGVPQQELTEALLQVAVYAGVPAANTAFAIAKSEFAGAGSPPAEPEDQP